MAHSPQVASIAGRGFAYPVIPQLKGSKPLPRSMIGDIIKPTDAQGTGMAGTDRTATPVGGGAGGAAIGRDVADRQRLTTALGDGDGFYDCHGRRVGLLGGGRQGRGDAARELARCRWRPWWPGNWQAPAGRAGSGAATTQTVLGSEGRAVMESGRHPLKRSSWPFSLFSGGFALNQLPIHYPNRFSG
jgi:hypothetical protein